MTRGRTSLTPVAKKLRKAENAPEARLWLALKARKLDGFKFRRQLPIGRFIADFACIDRRLVVELDGSQHDVAIDEIRDRFMRVNGWSVARFPSSHMLSVPEVVLETISAILEGSIVDEVVSHDFVFRPVIDPSSGASRHLLPLEGEKWDISFMRRAIALTRPGTTWPNPSVGCVIVKDGEVVGEATTGEGGRPHAEEIALAMAGENASGATAYVTLEPCGQRSTGAPSCSQRLVEAGIARVVFACADPSPYASHIGVERMREAGIVVEHGLLANEARHLIAPTAHFHTTGRPLLQESETGVGFDAEFVPESADLTAELAAWAGKGYRHLYVKPRSGLAEQLHELGYLSE